MKVRYNLALLRSLAVHSRLFSLVRPNRGRCREIEMVRPNGEICHREMGPIFHWHCCHDFLSVVHCENVSRKKVRVGQMGGVSMYLGENLDLDDFLPLVGAVFRRNVCRGRWRHHSEKIRLSLTNIISIGAQWLLRESVDGKAMPLLNQIR